MRQQDVWAAPPGRAHTGITLRRTLYEIGRIITHADPICGHLRWAEEYSFLVPNKMPSFDLGQGSLISQNQDQDGGKNAAAAAAPLLRGEVDEIIHGRLLCALLHQAGCKCPDSIAFGALYIYLQHPCPSV